MELGISRQPFEISHGEPLPLVTNNYVILKHYEYILSKSTVFILTERKLIIIIIISTFTRFMVKVVTFYIEVYSVLECEFSCAN